MGLVSPTQSNPGDTIEADDINTPVNQLAAVINGSIETANIADSAVTTAKLADDSVTPAKWTNPYCFAARDSGGTTLTDGAVVQLNLATEYYDYNNNFATSAYTAPVPGVYHFDMGFLVSGAIATPVSVLALLYVDGVEARRGSRVMPGAADGGCTLSCDVLLDAGDVVTFRAFQDSAGNEATDTAAGRTWANGHLVHPT